MTLVKLAPGETKVLKLTGAPTLKPAIVNGEPAIGLSFQAVESMPATLSTSTVFSGKAAPSESLVRELNASTPPEKLLLQLKVLSNRLDEIGPYLFGSIAISILEQRLEDLKDHSAPAVAQVVRSFIQKLQELPSSSSSFSN